MILEGLVTTLDAAGRLNVAPMGPIVEPDMAVLRLRPFRTSQTYRNLKARPRGVFHVVDDVLLLAKGAIGRIDAPPATFPAITIPDGRVIASACRWYEFTVESLDDSQERTEIVARVAHVGRLRDYFGLNRAKHAVVEAAILATRLHLLPRDDVLRQIAALRVPVEKTAGPAEREAFALLESHILAGGAVGAGRGEAPLPAPTVVTVSTGARLHFGPLAVGATRGRQFGGVGMMVDSPGFSVSATAGACRDRDEVVAGCDADGSTVDGGWIERAKELLRRLRQSEDAASVPALKVSIERAIPAHSGLGSGTQFAMAVGQAFFAQAGGMHDPSIDPRRALAERVGRGLRSAVGLHGFFQGGLIVDGGKATPDALGTLAARATVPESWRVVLITPCEGTGMSGAEERQAFQSLAPMPAATSDRLSRIALLDLVPAFTEGDLRAAGAALGEFGRVVGDYFAPVQGGVIGSPRMRDLAEQLRRRGFEGVGQSSWGPTLFVLTDGSSAQDLLADLKRDPHCTECDLHIARPLNHGATLERS